MRSTFLLIGGLLLSGCMMPPGHARTEVGVVLPAPEPELVIYAYSSSVYGPWRSSYIHWTPVTLYYYSGRYHRRPVAHARTVVVYRRGNDYFFPPRDRAWVGVDRRYNYAHSPTWGDHGRAKAKHKDNGRRAHGKP